MPTDDNDAYGDLDKSNPKFIYGQFLSSPKYNTHQEATVLLIRSPFWWFWGFNYKKSKATYISPCTSVK